MQATRRKDTSLELAVRRALHSRGLRYRVDVRLPELPRRRMDIVFTKARLVVACFGCYWHACPVHGTSSRTNPEFWASKLATNRARDADTERRLLEAGWHLTVVWEHEPPEEAADRIQVLLSDLRSRQTQGLPELRHARPE